MRIPTLLQRLSELSGQPERRTAIDVDLMLDYTRVLYADLLEWRGKLAVTVQHTAMPAINEPTLSEMADAMNEQETDDPVTGGSSQPATPAVSQNTQPIVMSGHLQSTAPDIRTIIGINDKYQIMSELFGNDKRAYEDALDHINASPVEDQAEKGLRERLWVTEERSDAAQRFYDLVKRFKH